MVYGEGSLTILGAQDAGLVVAGAFPELAHPDARYIIGQTHNSFRLCQTLPREPRESAGCNRSVPGSPGICHCRPAQLSPDKGDLTDVIGIVLGQKRDHSQPRRVVTGESVSV